MNRVTNERVDLLSTRPCLFSYPIRGLPQILTFVAFPQHPALFYNLTLELWILVMFWPWAWKSYSLILKAEGNDKCSKLGAPEGKSWERLEGLYFLRVYLT